MMTFLNARRLRDYPRLMLITTWIILGANLLLHQGWIGALGQVIGGDFIMFYSTGEIYRSNPGLIYDYDTQVSTQQSLVSPTSLPGYNPFMNPPFVAPMYSLLTYLPLPWSMVIWTVLAFFCVIASAWLLIKLLPSGLLSSGFNFQQLAIITLSFFPFIEGVQSGQNHWLTLFLITGLILATVREKWYLAGVMAGLLIYKPQFIVGFIVLWLVWRNLKAIFSFGLVAALWVGIFTLINGFEPFQTYSQLSKAFMLLPYISGFPRYLLVTFYGFTTSLLPQSAQSALYWLSQILFVLSLLGLAWLAYKLYHRPMAGRTPALVAALLVPLLATPYALLHDLLILIPGFVLCLQFIHSRNLLYAAIITYLGAFLFTLLGVITNFPWVSLLTMGLSAGLAYWLYTNRKILLVSTQL